MIRIIRRCGFLLILVFTILMSDTGSSVAQNFPPLYVTVHDSAASQGYYYMAPYRSIGPYTCSHPLLILDRLGRIVYYRIFQGIGVGTTTTEDFKIQNNGRMSYFLRSVNHFCIMDSTFCVIDSMTTAGFEVDVHDLQSLPDSHYLILGKETRIKNLTGYHWFGFNHTSPGSANAQVIGVVIQEFDQNKNLVWEWKSHDHFDFSDVDSVWLSNPNKVDWTHANAVEPDNDGNILLCCRHFNEITKINRQTGDIIWRFGGKRNQFSFTNDPLRFNGQHDIRRLDNGHITLFDNGRYHDPAMARALEYVLDENSMTATLVWEYIHDSCTYSTALGNFQVMDNDNRLIDYGNLSGEGPWMIVVKPDKSKIMEISSPDQYASYRVFNYDTLPWEFPRPYIDCYASGGTYYLEAEPGHAIYKWSTGEATQSIAVTDTGEYWVFVPHGEGYISSERIRVYDPANPCLYLDTGNGPAETAFSLQCDPNPVTQDTRVKLTLSADAAVSLSVTHLSGITMFSLLAQHFPQGCHLIPIDFSDFPSGIYFLRAQTGDQSFVKKIVVL